MGSVDGEGEAVGSVDGEGEGSVDGEGEGEAVGSVDGEGDGDTGGWVSDGGVPGTVVPWTAAISASSLVAARKASRLQWRWVQKEAPFIDSAAVQHQSCQVAAAAPGSAGCLPHLISPEVSFATLSNRSVWLTRAACSRQGKQVQFLLPGQLG